MIALVAVILIIDIINMKMINASTPQGGFVNSEFTLFQHDEFPFTFEYPADWNIVELPTDGRTPNSVFDNKLKDLLIGKNVSSNPSNRTTGEWLIVRKGRTPFPSNARPPSTKIVLDGQEFNIYEVGSGLYVNIIQVDLGSNVYELEFQGGSSSQMLEKLKSSFKFNGLSLFFYVGGSITGNFFEVGITGSRISYREYAPNKKEIKRIDRPLTSNELAEIKQVVMDSGLISLESQAPPTSQTDPGSYDIFILMDSKRNELRCYIPPYGEKPVAPCQKGSERLRLKINSMLGVNIW